MTITFAARVLDNSAADDRISESSSRSAGISVEFGDLKVTISWMMENVVHWRNNELYGFEHI